MFKDIKKSLVATILLLALLYILDTYRIFVFWGEPLAIFIFFALKIIIYILFGYFIGGTLKLTPYLWVYAFDFVIFRLVHIGIVELLYGPYVNREITVGGLCFLLLYHALYFSLFFIIYWLGVRLKKSYGSERVR